MKHMQHRSLHIQLFVREAGPSESGQGAPRHQIFSTKEIYYTRGAREQERVLLRQIARSSNRQANKRPVLQEWVFKEKKWESMLGSWEILTGHVSQIMKFACWYLVFCGRNESVVK